jgi:predicted TIM-barrel fold metal-dependent hydrolase
MHRLQQTFEPPLELPFTPGQASNGEFVPRARTRTHRAAAALAHELADQIAHKQSIDRRRFLMSAGGLAATLAAINLVGCAPEDRDGLPRDVPSGGTYAVPTDADPDAVRAMLDGDEFIFDVQTHHVDPRGAWVHADPPGARVFRALRSGCPEADPTDCLGRYYYAHDIFLESDTSMAVLSVTPAASDQENPLPADALRRTRELLDELSPRSHRRVLLHSIVVPNAGPIEAQLDRMQAQAEHGDVAAWKVYTPYGPDGRGWSLDDPGLGVPVIEQARRLGVKIICAHKGLPLFGFDRATASPRDIGIVARAYPDVSFVVYHAGWDPGAPEGPYDPASAALGMNALIKSLLDNGIGPNQNVYAELGSTWRGLMSDRTQAAHALGKLVRYVGEDNVLWGTDCIWTGSPQPQIVAFRAFEIDPEFAARFGYAPLTPELKRKIFGLNAARLHGVEPVARQRELERDEVERLRLTWREAEADAHAPRYEARGPISRRGMLAWVAAQGGRWQPG